MTIKKTEPGVQPSELSTPNRAFEPLLLAALENGEGWGTAVLIRAKHAAATWAQPWPLRRPGALK